MESLDLHGRRAGHCAAIPASSGAPARNRRLRHDRALGPGQTDGAWIASRSMAAAPACCLKGARTLWRASVEGIDIEAEHLEIAAAHRARQRWRWRPPRPVLRGYGRFDLVLSHEVAGARIRRPAGGRNRA